MLMSKQAISSSLIVCIVLLTMLSTAVIAANWWNDTCAPMVTHGCTDHHLARRPR